MLGYSPVEDHLEYLGPQLVALRVVAAVAVAGLAVVVVVLVEEGYGRSAHCNCYNCSSVRMRLTRRARWGSLVQLLS